MKLQKNIALVICFVLVMLNGQCPTRNNANSANPANANNQPPTTNTAKEDTQKEPTKALTAENQSQSKKIQEKKKIAQLFASIKNAAGTVLGVLQKKQKEQLASLEKTVGATSESYWTVLNYATEEDLKAHLLDKSIETGKTDEILLLQNLSDEKDVKDSGRTRLLNFDPAFIKILSFEEEAERKKQENAFIVVEYVKTYLKLHQLIEEVSQAINKGEKFAIASYQQQLEVIQQEVNLQRQIFTGTHSHIEAVVNKAIDDIIAKSTNNIKDNIISATFKKLITLVSTSYKIEDAEKFISEPTKIQYQDIEWVFFENIAPPNVILDKRDNNQIDANYTEFMDITTKRKIKKIADSIVEKKDTHNKDHNKDKEKKVKGLVKEINGAIAATVRTQYVALQSFSGAAAMKALFDTHVNQMNDLLQIVQWTKNPTMLQKAPTKANELGQYRELIKLFKRKNPSSTGLDVNGQKISFDEMDQQLQLLEKKLGESEQY